MNCTNPETSAAVLRRLPEKMETEAARKLLLTAAVRRHAVTAQHMLQLPAMMQHIDTATVEAMLLPLLPYGNCVVLLCKLLVAFQLSADAVATLLLAATQGSGGRAEAVYNLCSLPAAAWLNAA
jgi:hypothetical protein